MTSSSMQVGNQLRRVLFPTNETVVETKSVTSSSSLRRALGNLDGGSLATLGATKQRDKRRKDASKSRVASNKSSVLVDLNSTLTQQTSRSIKTAPPRAYQNAAGLMSLFSLSSGSIKSTASRASHATSRSGSVVTSHSEHQSHRPKNKRASTKQSRVSKKHRKVKFAHCRSSVMQELVSAFPPADVLGRSKRSRNTDKKASAVPSETAQARRQDSSLALLGGEGLVPTVGRTRQQKNSRQDRKVDIVSPSPSPARPPTKRANTKPTPMKAVAESQAIDRNIVEAVMGSGGSRGSGNEESKAKKISKTESVAKRALKAKSKDAKTRSNALEVQVVVQPLPTADTTTKTRVEDEVEKRRSSRRQVQTKRYSPEIAELAENKQRKNARLPKKPPIADPVPETRCDGMVERRMNRKSKRKKESSVPSGSSPIVTKLQEPIALKVTATRNKSTREPLPSSPLVEKGKKLGNAESIYDWTAERLDALKHAQADVDPMSSTFWIEVAVDVPGKNASECREKWFSLVKTPALRNKKAAEQPISGVRGPDGLSGVRSPEEDDIFNSTPMRDTNFSADAESKENVKPNKKNSMGIDVGSPIVVPSHSSKAVTNEYDSVGTRAAPAKAGYKTYLLGLKRGLSRAVKERRGKRKPKEKKFDPARNVSEYAGSGEVEINGHLTPGGTLKIKSLMDDEGEDDFFNEMYDIDERNM